MALLPITNAATSSTSYTATNRSAGATGHQGEIHETMQDGGHRSARWTRMRTRRRAVHAGCHSGRSVSVADVTSCWPTWRKEGGRGYTGCTRKLKQSENKGSLQIVYQEVSREYIGHGSSLCVIFVDCKMERRHREATQHTGNGTVWPHAAGKRRSATETDTEQV
ncbi:hypothetical protein B0H10DRAFT_1958445 [Mycena sp. CBHHK59/15]|nr:hypothetical protein B0H10DRAFT_1958445 [Mycena sp. CBHHK59/15]